MSTSSPQARVTSGPAAVAVAAVIGLVALVSCAPSPEDVAAEHAATVTEFCADCHNSVDREADLVLEQPELSAATDDRAKWEKVIHKLNAGLMPPPGEPRPEDQAVASLVSWLETTLDANPPESAAAPVRRLTRAAYGNAIRDLLGFPIDVE
jgi:hypothetical protein